MDKFFYDVEYFVDNTTVSRGFETEEEMFEYAVYLDNHGIMLKDVQRITYRIIDNKARTIKVERYESGKPSILVWIREEA